MRNREEGRRRQTVQGWLYSGVVDRGSQTATVYLYIRYTFIMKHVEEGSILEGGSSKKSNKFLFF